MLRKIDANVFHFLKAILFKTGHRQNSIILLIIILTRSSSLSAHKNECFLSFPCLECLNLRASVTLDVGKKVNRNNSKWKKYINFSQTLLKKYYSKFLCKILYTNFDQNFQTGTLGTSLDPFLTLYRFKNEYKKISFILRFPKTYCSSWTSSSEKKKYSICIFTQKFYS